MSDITRYLQFNVITTTHFSDNQIEIIIFYINLNNEIYYELMREEGPLLLIPKVFNTPVRTGQQFSLGSEVKLKDKVHKKNDPQMLVNISKIYI